MKQKTIFIASAVLLALAFATGVQYYKSHKTEQARQATLQNQEALVRFHSPSIGDANAPVHLVEFFDPACEACRAFYPFVKELMAAHPGNIRLTIRYAPFHQGADQVAMVLEAARKQGKYWQALEALLAAQPEWAQHHAANLDLVWKHLDGLGLDIERLKKDAGSPEIAGLVKQDIDDAKTLNITRTPTFFVNGKPLPSFGTEQLQKLVEEALASAGKGN